MNFVVGEVYVGTGEDQKKIVVLAVPSRKSAMEKIKKVVGDGEHLILTTDSNLKWNQVPDISASNLTLCWENLWKKEPSRALSSVHELFRDLPDTSLEYRVFGNSPGAAVRDDIHAHILIASTETWKRVPRIVDPLEPLPSTELKG